MAITKDPFKISEMVKSPKANFSRLTEDLQKKAADIAKGSVFNNSKGDSNSTFLNKVKSKFTDFKKQGMGIFEDILCCKAPAKVLMTDIYTESLDRRLSNEESLDACELSKIRNPMDAALKATKLFAEYPGLLSGDASTRLNTLIRSDLLEKMNILGLGNIVPTCIFGNTFKSLSGSSQYLGTSLKDKNELRNLLAQNACTAAISNTPLVSGWLSKSVAANLINTVIDSVQNGPNFTRILESFLHVTDQRSSVLGGLLLSISNAYDYNTRTKLNGIAYVYNFGNLNTEEKTMLKYDAKNILDSLDREKENKDNLDNTNPREELKEIYQTIEILDPNWKIWDAKGNSTLCELSQQVLRSRDMKTITLDATATTTLTTEHKIVMACRFTHKDNKEKHAVA